ncbi:MAG TPA: PEBP family protein [Xanthomonadaceae bacterium]|nr:PEBP family protein [Xanthomonadaceae bacterium]
MLAAGLLLSFAAAAQQGDGTDVAAQVHTFKPDKQPPSAQAIAALRLPAGFSVQPLATGLQNVRVLAVAGNGDIYASRREQGDVLLLRDRDEDGTLDAPPRVVARRAGAHGLAIRDDTLYLATANEVFRAGIRADGTLEEPVLLIGDLPDGGQHPNRTLAFGPDGMLYISVGSSCNACNETNPEHATLLRAAPDGKSRTIFASGLRNTIGFAWDPASGELWGMDHGIDFLGDEVQPEELNHLVKGKQYGWPHVWGRDGVNPQSTPPGGIDKAQWAAISEPMVLGYTAHAAPMQMLFYTGAAFPREYRGDAFVTMRGSWNRKPASGYEVVRVRFERGRPVAFEPFLQGFLVNDGRAHIARPVGLAQTPGGALLVGDDANGVIYRIGYGKPAKATASRPPPVPSAPLQAQLAEGNGVPLLLDRIGEAPAMRVDATAFAPDGTIDRRYSEYHDGVSPPLSWQAVDGARSYAIVVEDPDAKPLTPFVHWVAWNIPADLGALPEGLPEQMRLTVPEGVMQGATTRGSVGYYGPRPPVGEPPHRYHFQVLALDTLLDLPPGADRDALLQAARGHVIGKGAAVATYAQRQAPLK